MGGILAPILADWVGFLRAVVVSYFKQHTECYILWTRLDGFGLAMRYWLMKSEPDELSIDDLARAPRHSTAWFGVRNYQARNFMRDQMQTGDGVLFYHSSCAQPGIA